MELATRKHRVDTHPVVLVKSAHDAHGLLTNALLLVCRTSIIGRPTTMSKVLSTFIDEEEMMMTCAPPYS